MIRFVLPAVVLLLLLLPGIAAACPVCLDMREANRLAFVWTAALMSLLPLGLIGGTAYWLWRQFRTPPHE
jgi:hypothetical protein